MNVLASSPGMSWLPDILLYFLSYCAVSRHCCFSTLCLAAKVAVFSIECGILTNLYIKIDFFAPLLLNASKEEHGRLFGKCSL